MYRTKSAILLNSVIKMGNDLLKRQENAVSNTFSSCNVLRQKGVNVFVWSNKTKFSFSEENIATDDYIAIGKKHSSYLVNFC